MSYAPVETERTAGRLITGRRCNIGRGRGVRFILEVGSKVLAWWMRCTGSGKRGIHYDPFTVA